MKKKKTLEEICEHAEEKDELFGGTKKCYNCKVKKVGVDPITCFEPWLYKNCYYHKK